MNFDRVGKASGLIPFKNVHSYPLVNKNVCHSFLFIGNILFLSKTSKFNDKTERGRDTGIERKTERAREKKKEKKRGMEE